MFLIQGIYWESAQMLDSSYKPELGLAIEEADLIVARMFSGIIYRARHGPPGYVGLMNDNHGRSLLTDVVLNPSPSFTKKYGRPDGNRSVLSYKFFRKEEGVWYGRWQSEHGGGDAQCVITEVPDTFPSLLALS
jgi:hypothetical protein